MRFTLISTHVDQTTGYSKVAYELLRQLATLSPSVKTYHFGFQRHPARANLRKYPDGIVSYDAAANEDPKEDGFGFNKINEYLDMVNPDVVMIYNDPLIIYKFLEAMKHERGKSSYKLWIYVDQVYSGIAAPLVQKINEHADRVYCFTDIWKKRYLEYGPFPDVQVLEHAIDPAIFTNMAPEGRKAIRKNMNISKDAIVLLNANRNSQRKRLDLTIMGFVEFLKRRPTANAYLMLATGMSPQTGSYYDIQRIILNEIQSAGLDVQEHGRRIVLIDTAPPNVVDDSGINQIYNIADIGINTSDGEGFGLCQLEHMYTGAPQIVADIGSYRSFLDESVAEFIPTGDRCYFSGGMPLGSHAPSILTSEVANAIERIVDTLDEKRKHVNAYTFKSWSTVCDGLLEDVLKMAQTQ
jgi:glycosyltransferase involved in cell wall biosynthesis